MYQKIEDVADPVIGEQYLVQAVVTRYNLTHKTASHGMEDAVRIIAVQGPMHNDPDLGFEKHHYHYDWRFMDEDLFRIFQDVSIFSHQFGFPWMAVLTQRRIKLVAGTVLMEYRRHLPQHPSPPSFRRRLEGKYKAAKMVGGICPHRGISCAHIKAVNGEIICPGHGLIWREPDGVLVETKGTRLEKKS